MQLDPSKCSVGTVGYLQIGSSADLMDGDWDWIKEPSVVLDENRRWVPIEPNDLDNTFEGGATELPVVFSSWQSAVREVIERDRLEARALLAEADQLMDEATAAERMLKAELVAAVERI